jgi:hypothetical protein
MITCIHMRIYDTCERNISINGNNEEETRYDVSCVTLVET